MEKYNRPTKLIELAEDYYDVLGLKSTATSDEIQRAYRRLSFQYHPDRASPEKRDEVNEIFTKLGQVFSVLGEEKERQKYDLCLLKIDKFNEEKQKSEPVIANNKNFDLIKEKPVTAEFTQQVIAVIKAELVSSGLTMREVWEICLENSQEELEELKRELLNKEEKEVEDFEKERIKKLELKISTY